MEQELRILLKAPGNEVCADCGARYPRFASITLAIFLCNRCYGIHRSVGAHITRTKTVGLDRWTPEEVHRMRSIGNAVANAHWEQNVPAGCVRPTGDSPDPVVEKWIRDKYERKLFCPVNTEPPSPPPLARDTSSSAAGDTTAKPQVKLLPRGSLRCGVNCLITKVPDDLRPSSSSKATTSDNLNFKNSSHESGAPSTRAGTQTPLNSKPSPEGMAAEYAGGEIVDLEDDEFGDFVQPEGMPADAGGEVVDLEDDEFGDFIQA